MQLHLGGHLIDCTHRTAVMGILNVSYDSPVSESIVPPRDALVRALELRAAGAAIIDVGAHSTRTGARDLSPQEEIERVCPVIEAISAEGIPVSVDTWAPGVAEAAAGAGVHLLNDVTGLADPKMVAVAVRHQLPVIAMHMRGEPKRHRDVNQDYDAIGEEVRSLLVDRARDLEAAGVPEVWLDPGFGFAKTPRDNLQLLRSVPALIEAGHPVLISASRKGFLGELLGLGDRQDVEGLLDATIAFNVLAARLGVHLVRVHDVEEISRALAVVNAMRALEAGE